MFVLPVDNELYLRIAEEKDAEELFKLIDRFRESLREWLPWIDRTIRKEDTITFIQFSQKGFAEFTSMNLVILYREKIVGVAGFNEMDVENKVLSIGYWLGQCYQGNGIMNRVVRSLADFALNHLHFNRIEIRIAVGNKKSQAIPEKLGFKKEGVLRETEWLYDHYVDHIVYSLLASDNLE
ncbi:ribosomal-protein-serine acetyltransferase [Lederbergia galactosidilyticus]|uniref:GNAT family N-acetyltransferase n=1 Tax=Lederbergia galactosidilytica TaxID=217031 RepID=UPI001AE242E2|nr:GNAT family protein [Lederbergia galactosidilytica]MBP1913804.1 ribosomal-protein-serine acetyltransferase [Lederbergia galactosidilytica]